MRGREGLWGSVFDPVSVLTIDTSPWASIAESVGIFRFWEVEVWGQIATFNILLPLPAANR